ncbi:unnamed protein product [Moneuplotes crassus]|uniref:Uncharacterized protein n=1 Tax=Euplotes crassus TaxID=5936 RepID=A0AAD1U046_EUPCR|nr:unnamed protein product [Moneuplotes crassus]
MVFPKCQHTPCQKIASYYLTNKTIYVCSQDKFAQYPNHDSILLIPSDSISTIISIINECRKELLTYYTNQGLSDEFEKCKAFSISLHEQCEHVLTKLKTARLIKAACKYSSLLSESQDIEEILKTDTLFTRFAVAKSWNEAYASVTGQNQKSPELTAQELNKKYHQMLDKTSKKLGNQRKRIQKSHQLKIHNLNSCINSKLSQISDLNQHLKHQGKSHKAQIDHIKSAHLYELSLTNFTHCSTEPPTSAPQRQNPAHGAKNNLYRRRAPAQTGYNRQIK